MRELLKYHTRIYLKSNKIIMPFLVWLVYLRISYSQKPLSYVPNIAMSMVFLFFIMIWVGFSYMDLEDSISEQLLILKVQSINRYNVSKVLFLIFLGLLMSVFGMLFPLAQDRFNQMFTYRITFADVLIAFGLHCILAFLGAMVGSFFHPRIIKDRKLAILLAITTALIGYTKGPIISKIPITRFGIWIFPPIYDILESFTNIEYFNFRVILITFIYGSVYGILFMLVQLYLLKRNKF